MKGAPKYNLRRPSTQGKMATKQTCSYCGSSYPPWHCLAYGEKHIDYGKIGQYKGVCRSKRTRAVNEEEHERAQGSVEESGIRAAC